MIAALAVGPRTLADEPPGLALEYAPAPAGNPLKGLVPYAGAVREDFPHSLEFRSFPLSDLMTGPDRFSWTPLDAFLDDVAGRGHQAVFRVYLEYPGRKDVLPKFLVEGGLKIHRYMNTNTQPLPPSPVETPDYEDPRLRAALKSFIAAMGARYDGDPRVGFLTAGLLGTWGEWHDYPRTELFASKAVQAEVMDAFEKAFRASPVLLRNPAGPGDVHYAENASRRLGYHDDSFAWTTLDTGRPQDAWYFLPTLKRAGPSAVNAWKTRPIGGEIRPEAWGLVFDDPPGPNGVQDFGRSVAETHATWLMDSGMFRKDNPKPRRDRAEAAVRRMGYEFHVPRARLAIGPGRRLTVAAEVENRGVAPLYHDWPARFALLGPSGTIATTFEADARLAGLLPGGPSRALSGSFDLSKIGPGRYAVLLSVPNPLPKGPPIRFANKEQDRDRPGWLTLGTIQLPATP